MARVYRMSDRGGCYGVAVLKHRDIQVDVECNGVVNAVKADIVRPAVATHHPPTKKEEMRGEAGIVQQSYERTSPCMCVTSVIKLLANPSYT